MENVFEFPLVQEFLDFTIDFYASCDVFTGWFYSKELGFLLNLGTSICFTDWFRSKCSFLFTAFFALFSEFNSTNSCKTIRSSVVFRSSYGDFNFGDFGQMLKQSPSKNRKHIKELMNLSPKEVHLIQNNSKKHSDFPEVKIMTS